MPGKLRWRLSNVSLRTMMLAVVVLVLVFFVTAQIIMTATINHNEAAAQQESVRNRAEHLRAQTDLFIENITQTGKELAFNSLVLKYIDSSRIRETLRAYNRVQVLLEAVSLSNPGIKCVFLTDFDSVHFGSTTTESFALQRELGERFQREGWPSEPQNLSLEQPGGGRDLVLVTPSLNNHGAPLYAVISYQLDMVGALLEMAGDSENCMLMDEEGRTIMAHCPLGDGRGAEVRAQSRPTARGWHWLVTRPASGTGQFSRTTERLLLAMDGVLIAALLLFLALHERTVIRPIGQLMAFLDKNADGRSGERLNMTGDNEISRIAQEIDRMLDGMERAYGEAWEAQQSVYALKIAQQQARFNALQSQINPHFLYNTLECVRGIAMAHGIEEILDICASMADIFRYSIKGGEYVRLREEIDIVREYMGIMQIRQNNRYRFSMTPPEETLDMFIPRMILQPVVENAVFHGLERAYREPELTVSARVHEDRLELTARDNGVGMPADTLATLKGALQRQPDTAANLTDKGSIGLVNINDRIRLTCGLQYGLHIESVEGEGTTVTILLPIMRDAPNKYERQL